MHVGSCAAEVPDKFQIDAIIITPNFSGLRNFETGFGGKMSWPPLVNRDPAGSSSEQ